MAEIIGNEHSSLEAKRLQHTLNIYDACDHEQLRKLPYVQSGTCLLVFKNLRQKTLTHSQNVFDFFESKPTSGTNSDMVFLNQFFNAEEVSRLQKLLHESVSMKIRRFDLFDHHALLKRPLGFLCYQTQHINYFEFFYTTPKRKLEPFEHWYYKATQALYQKTESVSHLVTDISCSISQQLADLVQHRLQMDRVKILKFMPDWSRQVIAERRKTEEIPSFVGLRFPESDIPSQARALYLMMPFRIAFDVLAEPNPIAMNDFVLQDMDLSPSFIRSFSPLHVQYLKNMGVRSSLSFSIIAEGQLWGIIVCHNMNTLFDVDYKELLQIELLVRHYAICLINHKHRQEVYLNHHLQHVIDQIQNAYLRHQSIRVAVRSQGPSILRIFEADGFVLSSADEVVYHGLVPSSALLNDIWNYSIQQDKHQFHCNHLSQLLGQSVEKNPVAGVLMVSRINLGFFQLGLFIFRKPQDQEVLWAGSKEEKTSEGIQLPRTNFEPWCELVSHQAKPFEDKDIQVARGLFQGILNNLALDYHPMVSYKNILEHQNTQLNLLMHQLLCLDQWFDAWLQRRLESLVSTQSHQELATALAIQCFYKKAIQTTFDNHQAVVEHKPIHFAEVVASWFQLPTVAAWPVDLKVMPGLDDILYGNTAELESINQHLLIVILLDQVQPMIDQVIGIDVSLDLQSTSLSEVKPIRLSVRLKLDQLKPTSKPDSLLQQLLRQNQDYKKTSSMIFKMLGKAYNLVVQDVSSQELDDTPKEITYELFVSNTV